VGLAPRSTFVLATKNITPFQTKMQEKFLAPIRLSNTALQRIPASKLEQFPICRQLVRVQFCPGLDKALLTLRQTSCNHLQRTYDIDGDLFLIIGVEALPLVRRIRLCEHANDDSKEPTKLGQWVILDQPTASRMHEPGLER
jgi:hypothetical protein